MKNWLWIIGLFFVLSLHAEDGHRLWLRMERNALPADVCLSESTERTATLDIASRELKDFWKGEGRVLLRVSKDGVMRDGFTICRKGLDVELSSASDNGVLYAAYDLLRRQQAGDLLSDGVAVTERPSSHPEPLGQSRWDGRERLRRTFGMEVGRAARNGFPIVRGICSCQCFCRH
jgi:alpha-glucuronidase